MLLLGVDVGSVAVSLTYDGTGAPLNDRILPYLRYPRRDQRSSCR
jgi:hypothetical protein